MTTNEHTARLEELRAVIRAEEISQGELIELASLAPYIEPGDVELLQWAGVPEFPDDTTDADTGEAYNRAINYARELGAEHGRNAAEWFLQDILRSTRDAVALRRILQGLEDGDPEILDELPGPDLSGQWADSLTGPRLIVDALDAAGHSRETVHGATYGYCKETEDWGSDICDAYEFAFSDAVSDAIETAARAAVTV